MRRRALGGLITACVVLALTACTPPEHPTTDGVLRIVASTNVYGDLAATIAPDAEITSIIDDGSADPHGFEANPRVQLALARADIVIANGGGYDDFVDTMLTASGNTSAIVLHAVDFAGTDPTADGFNEHVWYLYPAMIDLVGALGDALDDVDPGDPNRVARVAGLQGDLADLAERAATLSIDHAGQGFIVTEPVPQYLLGTAGLVDLTPPAFTHAIEQDTDVSPALLHEVVSRIPDAVVVVVNGQTGGPQTDAVIEAADTSGVPVLTMTETLPEGMTYLEWQAALIDQLREALSR